MKYDPVIIEDCKSYYLICNENTNGNGKELACDVT